MIYNQYNTFVWQILAKKDLFCAIFECVWKWSYPFALAAQKGNGILMKATLYAHRERLRNFKIETYSRMNNTFAFHSTIELVLVRKGKVQAWIGDAEMTISDHEIAVILCNEAHQFHSLENGVYTGIFIPTILCPEFVEEVSHKKAHYPVIRDKGSVERIRDALDMLSGGELNAIEEKGYLHVILGTVLKRIELEKAEMPHETSLPSRLLFYINEHYKEDISAEKLAQEFGYSTHYLSDSFRACFRISIGSYINTLRLKNAVMLIRERKKNITESAMESGFGSLRTFYRAFTAEFGCSPKEYLHRE